jgi:hypothetical protein
MMMMCGPDWAGSEQGEVEGSCELGNEPSDSIKCWEAIKWPHLVSWQSFCSIMFQFHGNVCMVWMYSWYHVGYVS